MNELFWLYLIIYILIFALGATLGSFCNVVIWRLPREESFVRGRSHCPACGHVLGPLDLVPLLSWLLLGRRCRYCGAPISRRYFILEVLTGALACGCGLVFGFSWLAAAAFALLAGLEIVAFIDHDTMTIPDGLHVYLLVPALALCFLLPDILWWEHLIGVFAASLPLLLLAWRFGGFGGGDIKLMAVCGLALGWKLILLALFLAILIGGGQALWLLTRRGAGAKTAFPFGPALVLGCAVSLLFGPAVLNWYFQFL